MSKPEDTYFDKLDIELIEWDDSTSLNGWRSKNSHRELSAKTVMLCRTVGFVIQEDKEKLGVVQNESEDCFGDCITIPKKVILRRTKLRKR